MGDSRTQGSLQVETEYRGVSLGFGRGWGGGRAEGKMLP